MIESVRKRSERHRAFEKLDDQTIMRPHKIVLEVKVTHPSKNKGNTFERELVNEALAAGIEAKRAWGSNGLSLGMVEEVDCLIGGFKIQAKRRKSINKQLIPTESVDCVAMRCDHGEALIVMRFSDWLRFLKTGG